MKAGVLVWVVFTAPRVGCVACVPVSVAKERVWILEDVTARPFLNRPAGNYSYFLFCVKVKR